MNLLRKLVRWTGYDLVRLGPSKAAATRLKLLTSRGITLTLDVGANTGQFARELRASGYRGRIVSFEPLGQAFAELERRAQGDPAWTAVRLALGDAERTTTLHVAGNSASSSLLPMLPRHLESAPESRYVGTEEIRVTTLDAVLPAHRRPDDRVFLKIDTQGYEKAVLDGAQASLAGISAIQLELSLVPLYEHGPLYAEMLERMRALGLQLAWVEPGFRDPGTGQLLQLDALFVR